MKRKISLVICLPLLVGLVVLGACSSGKSDKVYGYTYDELTKARYNVIGGDGKEEITKVIKYENNGETRYLIVSKNDEGDDPDDFYMSLSSHYIDKHRTDKTENYIDGWGQNKPDISKVIESYKVDAKNKTFEKENN